MGLGKGGKESIVHSKGKAVRQPEVAQGVPFTSILSVDFAPQASKVSSVMHSKMKIPMQQKASKETNKTHTQLSFD